MPKKTARRTRKHRKSPSKKVGLIAREKNADQSAKTKSALDNRFHRTALPISCRLDHSTTGHRAPREAYLGKMLSRTERSHVSW